MAKRAAAPAAKKSDSAAEAKPWEVVLGGESLELLPTPEALMMIERHAGQTLYSIAKNGAIHGIDIPTLAVAVIALAGAAIERDHGRAMVRENQIAAAFDIMKLGIGSNDMSAPDVPGMIVDAGVLNVTAAVAGPLMAAAVGAVDSQGRVKAKPAEDDGE